MFIAFLIVALSIAMKYPTCASTDATKKQFCKVLEPFSNSNLKHDLKCVPELSTIDLLVPSFVYLLTIWL